jgi:FAD/FMN-containing dehydrogenase
MKIGPDDPRYRAVIEKQFNKRYRAKPDYVRLVSSTDEVMAAVQDAVRENRRFVVTSGGHCLEGFVSDPDVRVIIDVSPMKRVYYDAEMRAIAVEAGTTTGETLRALHDEWGVVITLGQSPAIGMGGHVAGGAFGFLHRQLGLAVDYLYAVEVVTVGREGRASSVVATREASDPHRELWWAHTGGGAGNFGVATRFWFRANDASGSDPATAMPRAPESVSVYKAEWNWSDLDAASFRRMLQNHGSWCEKNSDAKSPNASLFTLLEIHRAQFGKVITRGVSTAGDAADRQWDAHVAALSQGIGAPSGGTRERMTWLDFALNPIPELFTMPPGGVSMKAKDALLKRRLTDRQIDVVHDYMVRTDYDVFGAMFGLATYGGRVNTIAPDATAAPQRGAILDIACNAGWLDPNDAEKNVKWVNAFYSELFADSGGVPVPGDAYDGALINHPDSDLADPAFNKSGVPWHTIYYQKNYPRLQRVKAQWDPRDVFRHALGVRPG